jgi:uncharacterized coiled-coil protein SlyX
MADDTSNEDTKKTSGDLRSLLRQLVTPVIEQVETKVSSQIEDEVAERIDELLSTRMATVDHAIGGLDRHLAELSARIDRLERHLGQALDAGPEVTDVVDDDTDDH